MGKNKDRKSELDNLVEDVRGRHSKRMNAILATSDDEDFAISYFKLLEYATPKLQRQEISSKIEIDKITIERVDIPIDEIQQG
tara:strand:+ start:503 stop:751 length:249 start_codon:yes stop_codon:yes gene_type:complete